MYYTTGLIQRICESVGCRNASVSVFGSDITVNLPKGNQLAVAQALDAAFSQALRPGTRAAVLLETQPNTWVRISSAPLLEPETRAQSLEAAKAGSEFSLAFKQEVESLKRKDRELAEQKRREREARQLAAIDEARRLFDEAYAEATKES